MKYDQAQLPLGSRERALAQLEKGDLIKALKTCKTGNITLESVTAELDHCLQKLYNSGSAGVILSGYYAAGVFGRYAIEELLSMMYTKQDIPGFLKQIYRFGIYEGFENEIEQAIQWHEARKLPDARAWRVKFQKIIEQMNWSRSRYKESINILQEDESINKNKDVYVELKPLIVPPPMQSEYNIPASENEEPYIISEVPRIKMERANQQHAKTLSVLERSLHYIGYDVQGNKLIDAFSVIKERPVIFEVKSITENNEREQTRRAVGQLYEYKFRYSLKDALLCLVFSREPFSQWTIDYLTQGCCIHVLWVNQDQLTGVSLKDIIG